MRSRQIEAGLISTILDDHGPPTAPTSVVLHGFAGSAATVDELIRPLLDRDQRVLVPDLVGHGRSDAPADSERYTMAACVDQLEAVCTSLAVGPVAVVGYSMGGRVALQWATRHPDRVTRLVTVGATPGIADPDLRRQRVLADEELAHRIETDGLTWFDDYWSRRPLFATQAGRVDESRRADLIRVRRNQRPLGLANSLRGMGTGAMTYLAPTVLRRVEAPALVVAGADDVKFVSVGRQLAADLADGQFRAVGEAGHAAHLEQPEVVGDLVGRFLAAS